MPYHHHPHIIICTLFISSIDYNVFIVLQYHLKDHSAEKRRKQWFTTTSTSEYTDFSHNSQFAPSFSETFCPHLILKKNVLPPPLIHRKEVKVYEDFSQPNHILERRFAPYSLTHINSESKVAFANIVSTRNNNLITTSYRRYTADVFATIPVGTATFFHRWTDVKKGQSDVVLYNNCFNVIILTWFQRDSNLISTWFQQIKTTSEILRRCDVVLRLADVATWFQAHIHVETTLCAQWDRPTNYNFFIIFTNVVHLNMIIPLTHSSLGPSPTRTWNLWRCSLSPSPART